MNRHPANISIVIPCFNEADCIMALYAALCQVMQENAVLYELVFIDDGSTDGTLDLLSHLSEYDSHVHWLSFSRNFGHQKALKAGLDHAKGEVIITMDADMQHPAALIPEMLALWSEGYDIVNTVRKNDRKCGWFKNATSGLFYRIMNSLADIPVSEGSADFRLLDAKAVDILRTCHEEYMFLRGMTSWIGFRQTQIIYEAHTRYAGKTKYSFRKMFSFALCGITSFSVRPLRWAIALAAFFALLAIAEIIYVIYVACFDGQTVSGWASLAILISVLGAAILLMLGIMGEYLGKLFLQCKQRPEYIIKDKE